LNILIPQEIIFTVKTFVWAVRIRGIDNRQTDRKRIEAFETWCWRKLLKIKWTKMVRNEEVYVRIGNGRTIRQIRTRWVGRVMRHNNYVGGLIEGKMEGKTPLRKTKGQVFGVNKEG
jgi:hypothetical protein